MTWAYKRVMSEQKTLNCNHHHHDSTNALEAQIAALIRQLEETKEAERLEKVRREAEAAAEKACKEEEQRRL